MTISGQEEETPRFYALSVIESHSPAFGSARGGAPGDAAAWWLLHPAQDKQPCYNKSVH